MTTLTTDQYTELKREMEAEGDNIKQNQGRLIQLKETAKSTYKVDSIKELSALRKAEEEKLDMQKTKKKIQMEKLCSIVPDEVLEKLEADYE